MRGRVTLSLVVGLALGCGSSDEVVVNVYDSGGAVGGSSEGGGSGGGGGGSGGGGGGGGGGGTNLGTWVDSTTVQFPTPIAAHASASGAGSIYTFGGIDGNNAVLGTIYEYDPTLGTVLSVASMAPRAYMEAVTVADKIYLFGGSDTAQIYADAFVFNPSTSQISPIASMPAGRDSLAGAAVGTDIYLFGGAKFDPLAFQASPTQTIWKYSTTSNSWSVVSATLPQPTQWAEALAYNGKIYVIGGGNFQVSIGSQTTVANYDSVYEFSPSTGSLTAKAPLPVATKMVAGAVIGSKLYVCAGERFVGTHNNQAPWCHLSKDTYAYDPATNAWTALASFSTNVSGVGAMGGRCLSGAAEALGKLYVTGGYTLPAPGMTVPPCPTSQGIVAQIAAFTPP